MIFNETYNRGAFLDFLRNFLPEDFVEREQDLSHIDSCKVVNQASELGVSKSLGVHVLEMSYGKDTDPRVAVATDAFRILATYQIDKALVIFKSDNSENYRFSLLTISYDINEKNKLVKAYSNARRFSFYLGPGAKARTPQHQLITKGRIKDVADLVERFSLEVVNKQFYLELVKHFDALVNKDTRLLSLPSQSDQNIRKSFAMRLIGRIMFCWFLKQKHSPTNGPLIPDALLSSRAVKDGYYHNILEPVFFGILNTPMEARDIRGELYDSVPYLNGGLFNPQHDDYYDLDRDTLVSKHINTLVILDEWFRDFFSLLETYNFTIDENTVFDQELSVDPEMLGRIFENLLAEINPETGSSERKRTGSYYTPRQIVEYMIDRSLVEYIKTKSSINEEKLEALVSYDLSDDSENPLTLPERRSIINAIDSLRLLDPACGSGAFPIGALQKIVWILQRVDADCELWLEKKLAKVPELYRQKIRKDAATNPFDYTRKLDIIKNSIFGVDIQPIAVEIARLRCFLTLVVESEVNDTKSNRGIEPLPNLDFKFVCANTLIPAPEESGGGNQLFVDDFEEKFSAAVDRYFSSSGASKSSAGNDIHRLIDSKVDEQLRRVQNLVAHADERYQAALAKVNKKSIDTHTRILTLWASYKNLFENKPVGFFDPKYFFPGIKSGFDIVIGNPPYIDSETMVKNDPEARGFYSSVYTTATGNWDLFVVFIEQGIKLLCEGGNLSFIVPNKLIGAKYSESVRSLMMSKNIRYIRDYSNVKVFKEASVYPIVFQVANVTGSESEVTLAKMKDIEDAELVNKIPYSVFSDDVYWDRYFIDPRFLDLIVKISSNKKLGKINEQILGSATVNEAYQLKEVVCELGEVGDGSYKKLINSGTIDPYVSLWGKKKTQYIKSSYDKPVISDNSLSKLLPKRYIQANSNKLIIAGMSKRLEVFFDKGEYIAGKSTTIILDNEKIHIRYLLAILNSKLISYWYQIYFKSLSLAGGYLRISSNEIKKIPIALADIESEKLIIELVDQIIDGKSLDMADSESKIEELLMNIYKLNEVEKEIIRNS